MDKLFSRRSLALELIRRGVLPGYAWRTAGELSDHAEDIAQSGCDSRTQLGDPHDLATQIVTAYRQRTLAGRHPVFAFAVAPLPLTLLAYAVYWLTGALLLKVCADFTSYASIALLLIYVGGMFLPSMVLAALICRSARRAGLSWTRASLACLPIFAFALEIFTSMELKTLDHGTFMIGVWTGPLIGLPVWPVVAWNQFGKLFLPMGIMFLMFLRERAQARELSLPCTSDNRPDSVGCGSRVHDISQAA